MSEKILLIDGHSILNRAFYGLPDLTNSEGKHTGAVYGFLNILFRTIEEEKPQYLTVAFDLKAPTFRHKMFEAYKGTRKPMPEELREQVPLIKEMLTAMGVNVVTKEGYEADDILGTLARKSEAAGMDATILSGDRDLLQLATDKVMIRLPKTVRGKTTIEDYHAQQVIEKYQVTPPQIIELKALMGDSADNIPGIPGVGEKTATKIIVEYGSIENAHEHLEELKPNRARESMREHYDMAQMSKALATICTDSPIEFSYEKAKLGNLYTKEAFLLCRQLEFKNLLNRFDSAAVQEDTLEQEFFTCADLAGCEALFAKAEAGKTAGVSLVTENGRVFGAGLALNEEEIYYIPVEGMITEGYLCGKLEGLLHKVSESNTENIMKSNTDDVKKDPENEISDVNTDGTLKYDKKCVCALDVKALLKHIKSDDPMAVFDAGVAAYLLNPLKSSYTYDDMAKEYLNGRILPAREELLGKKTVEKAWEESAEGLAAWACYMAYTALACRKPMCEALRDTGMWNVYTQIELPLIFTLDSMEKWGISVKSEELKSYGEKLSVRIGELEKQIWQQAGEEFNINSPKQMGVILFERGTRRIRLTDAGILLRRRAEEIIGLIDKTEKELAEQEALIDGHVTIGCGETRSVNVLADLIETFSQKYPNVTFDLVTGTADVLKEQMDRGLMDVALLLEPVDVGKYEFVRLKEGERQQVLMRPDDPLAQKEVVHPEDLKDLPLILPRRQDVQNEITNWFGAYYQKLNVRFTCNMPTNGAKMVRKGLGYLITVQGVSELWKEDEIVGRFLDPPIICRSVFTWKREQPFSLAATKFIDHIRENL